MAFCDAPACVGTHLLGVAQLTSAGTATLSFVPAIGAHQYTANFQQTANAGGSSSGAASLMVTGSYATTTSLTASGSAGDYALSATVTGVDGPAAPTGNVTFQDASNANIVVATAAVGAGTKALGFLNKGFPAVGVRPSSVAVADFNGDGLLDIVTANFGGNSVTVLLGNETGNFTAAGTFSTGASPLSVVVGDFNGDGRPDLAVANQTGNSVSLLLGNGDGTFTLKSTTAVGNEPAALAVGDFNGDGNADLAVVDQADATVQILRGAGDGTFTIVSNFATGTIPAAIAMGDFNGDGIADLAVANYGSANVSIMLGAGDGTFALKANVATGVNPSSLVAEDLNHDGLTDLAVANNGGTVTVLLGDGTGGFAAATVTADANTFANTLSIAAGDFNADGNVDLVTANYGDGTVSVLLGDGAGGFTAAAEPSTVDSSGGDPFSVAVGDFNGDGLSDLVTANYYSFRMRQSGTTATVLLSQVSQTVTASVQHVSVPGVGTHNLAASYAGDASYAASISGTVPVTASQAATPAFAPGTGTYAAAQNVAISDATPNATVYYTTDGSAPTTASAVYASPIAVSATETLSAVAAASGFANSPVATAVITIQIPPAITAGPVSQTILAGQTATLSVTATGTAPLLYHWFQGASPNTAAPVSGATAASFTTSALTATTSYWVQVSNGFGTPANSPTATVTVNTPPSITASPVSQTIIAGQDTTLSVAATGTAPLAYQWYQGFSPNMAAPVAGATAASFTTPALTATVSYWVQVSNGFGSPANSATATVTVNTPPSITAGPANQTILAGQAATLTVMATGTAPLLYQWFQGPSPNTAAPVAGATAASYTTPTLTATGTYWVQVSNVAGVANSATVTVTVNTPPSITAGPVSPTIVAGQTATLSVVATGTAPLMYQWYQGASPSTAAPVAGATAASFTTPALTVTTSYWVQVSNGFGSPANSATATITVNTPPAIVSQLASASSINPGQMASFSVVATGTAPLTYQWFQGMSAVTANPVAGATSAGYTTPGLTASANYWVQVSNVAGTANSMTFAVYVNQPPVCTLAVAGTSAALAVVATASCSDPQNQAVTETIAWGDGTSGTAGATTRHTYAAAGTYTVTLMGTDTFGLSGSAQTQITPNQLPVCTLGVVTGAAATYAVSTTAACIDPQNTPLTVTIDWGDGSVLTATNNATNTHTYAASGTYSVTLQSTDALGLAGVSAAQPVNVLPQAPVVAPGGSSTVAGMVPPPAAAAMGTQVTFVCASVSTVLNGQAVNNVLPSQYGITCTSPTVMLSSAPTPVNVTIQTTTSGTTTASRGEEPNGTLYAMTFPVFGLGLLAWRKRPRGKQIGILRIAMLAALCAGVISCGGSFVPPPVAATPTGQYYVTLVETVVNPPAPTGFIQSSLIVPLPVTATGN